VEVAFGHVLDREAVRCEPRLEKRRLAGPHLVLEPAAQEAILEDQAGVGREHQVRQVRLRRHRFDRNAECDQASCSCCHCRNASARTAPSERFIHGLISYSIRNGPGAHQDSRRGHDARP